VALVLVTDDRPLVLDVMHRVPEAVGHEAQEAAGGAEGVAADRRQLLPGPYSPGISFVPDNAQVVPLRGRGPLPPFLHELPDKS
jgi:hypothetical protein